MRSLLAPIAVSLISGIAGYVVFHPGWHTAAPLSDGSHASFKMVSEAVADSDLLSNATANERIGWVLEICKQPPGSARDFALYEAIQRLQPGDFLQAFTQLEELGVQLAGMDDKLREGIVYEALRRWLTVDPAGALRGLTAANAVLNSKFLKVRPGPQDLHVVYSAIALQEPDWLLKSIDSMTEKSGRDNAVATLTYVTAAHDPRKAAELLAKFRGGRDWRYALKGYLGSTIKSDPRTAVATALRELDDAEQNEMLPEIMLDAATLHPALMPDLLAQLDPKQRTFNTWRTFRAVISQPSIEPFDYVRARFAEDPALDSYGGNWSWVMALANRDPIKTLDWAKELPPAASAEATRAAIRAWGGQDASAMLAWLQTQPPDSLPSALPLEYMNSDPGPISAWAESLPVGDFREATRVSAANAFVNKGKLSEAMNAFPVDMASASARPAAQALAATLANKDLAGTVSWLGSLPESAGRACAAAGAVSDWAAKSPDDAAAWVESLNQGLTRDAATGALAAAIANADPTAGAEWVDQIGDPTTRTRAIAAVYLKWRGRDPDAAQAWLQKAPGLPDSAMRYIVHQSGH